MRGFETALPAHVRGLQRIRRWSLILMEWRTGVSEGREAVLRVARVARSVAHRA
jgi:hypothetical protein